MSRVDELISREFARWEQRGRGWKVWPQPVRPEPAFEEFNGYHLEAPPIDDSRHRGWLASLFESFEKKTPAPAPEAEPVEPEPIPSDEPLVNEFVASLPAGLEIPQDAWLAFIDSLDACVEPIAFEIVGTHSGIDIQFASGTDDAPTLKRQLNAFIPNLTFIPSEGRLMEAWNAGVGFIVDFGLAHEFMLPLRTGHGVDAFIPLIASLNELQPGETAVFQVLFQPVQHRWPSSVWRSVTDQNGKALFLNRPHLITGTKQKVESPLFGVVVRTAAIAANFERAAAIVQQMAYALGSFSSHEGNRLIPLHNEEYDYHLHEEDLLQRQSRRTGMLLNREELLGFVHFPSDEVQAPRLRRQRTTTKAAPASVVSPAGILLGHNVHAGQMHPVHLTAEQRTRHVHIIGGSGSGKSTLLFNLIRQDIERGDGIAVLDPHGDLIQRILGVIPKERIDDVVLVDPSDEEFPVGFNILHAHSRLERTLLASDLVSVFRRLSTSWGDQMDAVLRNSILAFLNSPRSGTLADLRRFLVESAFRKDYLKSVQDPEIVYYWERGFPLLAGTKSVGPIVTRLNDFLATPSIRLMVSQPESRLNFADIMDGGKIFLAKLPVGLAGRKDCQLLGSLIVSKFQQIAMSRQAQQAAARRDFWIYADEFDQFVTPSMAEILKSTRKYRVGLTLAHHDLQQLNREPEVASAVLTNTGTRIVFQVSVEDARKLEGGFTSFDAHDLQKLAIGEAVVRIGSSDNDFNLKIPVPEDPNPTVASEVRNRVITVSRGKYARPRAEVELELRRQRENAEPGRPPDLPKAKSKPSPPETKPAATPTKPVASPTVQPVTEPPLAPVDVPSDIPSAPETNAVLPAPASAIVTEVPAASPADVDQPKDKAVLPLVETTPVSMPVEPKLAPSVESKVVSTEPAKVPEAPVPKKMGRGSPLHQAVQERLQSAAVQLGFSASIESQLASNSLQAADLVLKKGSLVIAVEFGLANPTAREFNNIKKCLAAGFQRVAAVSLEPKRLQALARAVKTALRPEDAAKVSYHTPDELIEELKRLAAQIDASATGTIPQTQDFNGYEVHVHEGGLSAEERKVKEAQSMKLIAQIVLQQKKKKE